MRSEDTAQADRDNVQGAFYFVLEELRNEARVMVKWPEYLIQSDLGKERLERAIETAKRIAAFRLSGAELAKLYSAQIDAQARLTSMEDRPLADAARFEALAAALEPEEVAEEAEEAAYAEAIDILYNQERARAVLARATIISAAALSLKDFPATRWAIPGILAEGLAMLSAPPKAGKSWLALALSKAVASGGHALGRIRTTKGQALYVSLEDSEKRLRSRLDKLGGNFPAALDIVTEIPKESSLADFIESYCIINSDTRLVIIDTLGRAIRGDVSDYATMTAALDPLQRIALKYHVGLILVHHTKKGERPEGDVFDASLGSQAIFGAMDTGIILDRKRGASDAVLHVVGRDVPDADYSLELNPESMEWRMIDRPPEETATGPERREILAILRAAAAPMKSGEIARAVKRSPSTVSGHLKELERDRLVHSPHYGQWSIGQKPAESTESTESTESGKQGN